MYSQNLFNPYYNYLIPPPNFRFPPPNTQIPPQIQPQIPPNYPYNFTTYVQEPTYLLDTGSGNRSESISNNSVGETGMGNINLNELTTIPSPNPYPSVPTFHGIPDSSNSRGKQVGKKNHRWTEEDDKILISAWLNTTHDSIKGNSQTASGYWGEITRKFNQKTKYGLSLDQVKSHFKDCQTKVKSFDGCYKRATYVKVSGNSNEDYMKEAYKLWSQENQKEGSKPPIFTLEYFWKLVKDTPKWNDPYYDCGSKKLRINEAGDYTTSSGGITNDETVNFVRPEGQKAAKRRAKGKGKVEEDPQVEVALTSQNKKNELVEKMLELKKAEVESRKYKAALKFISRSTRHMTDEEKAEHRATCAILKAEFGL